MARGAIDGELAYLHGFADKTDIYCGGLEISGTLLRRERHRAFWERIEMERLALSSYYGLPRSSSRDAAGTRWSITGESEKAGCPTVHDGKEGFEPALGAALLANGLSGGRWMAFVDHLQVREAQGHPLDRIAWGRATRPDMFAD